MKRKIIVVFCTIALTTTALAAEKRASIGEVLKTHFLATASLVPASGERPSPSRPAEQPQQRAVPAHAVYNEFFYHVNFLKRKADKEEKAGKEAALLRSFYKRQAKLDDAQTQLLDRAAADLGGKLERMDQKAQKIIEKFRADVQATEIKPGQRPPAPPTELKAMQAERDTLVLRARDELRASLGEEAFARLDHYVQQNIATRMNAERFDRPRPANPNRPR
jgi:hypothetical protein